jgi:hypothetical protein
MLISMPRSVARASTVRLAQPHRLSSNAVGQVSSHSFLLFLPCLMLNLEFYCPKGSFSPLRADIGYFTSGGDTPTQRTTQKLCPP